MNTLNNEVVKDGVAPAATVDSGNGTQFDQNTNDQDVGMSSSTAGLDAVRGNRSGVNAVPNSTTSNKGTSYAKLFTSESSRKSVNFLILIRPVGNRIDVAVPVESIRAINERFINIAYCFFLGKRVAYPVVANYFSSMDGLDLMPENGSWFICNNPLTLKKWNPNVNLLKEDVVNFPVWVKLHGVPMTAFSGDGLSNIATKLGTPLMLDSYRSDM
nr:hypothetical protein [Tanacetum cinerariifolium]